MEVNILTRDFHPDYSAVANKLTDLAEDLTLQDVKVTVYAGRPYYYFHGEFKEKNITNLSVNRVWSTRFGKDNLLSRFVDEMSFAASIFLKRVFGRRELNVIPSLPFSLQLTAIILKKLRSQEYIIINYELMPELLYSSGILSDKGFVYRFLDKMAITVLRGAKSAVAVSGNMRDRLEKKSGRKVFLLPPWADNEKIFPLEKKENKLLAELKLSESFVVSYSGNFGRYMDFDTVLDAVEKLGEARFLFIGNGAQKKNICSRKGVLYSDYLPRERLNESLNSGDLSLVLTNDGDEDFVLPSKVFELMACGKPVLAVAGSDSEVSTLIRKADCGFIVKPGGTQGFVDAVSKLMGDRDELGRLGENGRRYLLKNFTRSKVTKKFIDFIR